jgi:hypothetical protein
MQFDKVKIEIYLPREFILPVRDALHESGAGHVGQYDHCVSITEVSGYWRPLDLAKPYQGVKGQIEFGTECKLEVVCPASLAAGAVQAVRKVHPYEEPIINVIPLLSLEA